MGSRLSRQRSLDIESKLSKKRRQRDTSCGDAERSEARGGGDFLLTSLVLRSDKLPGILRKNNHSPYMRRVAWIRDIQRLLREQKVEQAAEVLKLLRKDLGLQGSSLHDILYKNAAFLNLVDPISHELLLSLARDMHCPKRETESFKSTNKICRQLIYHLTPHSKWTRQSVPRRKSQACLKTTLKKQMSSDVVNLSGIPLSARDVQRVALYLQGTGAVMAAVDLSFTGLRDDGLRLLLPALGHLPGLTTLALNGNRLTAAILKDLTEAVKGTGGGGSGPTVAFPRLTWVDLGNNDDIFALPQPLLVALRRRAGLRGSLPTIPEGGEAVRSLETSVEEPSMWEEEEQGEVGEEEGEDKLELRAWAFGAEGVARNVALRRCDR